MATSTFKKEFKISSKGFKTIAKLIEREVPKDVINPEVKNVELTPARLRDIIDNSDDGKQ